MADGSFFFALMEKHPRFHLLHHKLHTGRAFSV